MLDDQIETKIEHAYQLSDDNHLREVVSPACMSITEDTWGDAGYQVSAGCENSLLFVVNPHFEALRLQSPPKSNAT